MIELLVVIAIIAVLASMVLPALQRAMDASRQTACMSNLRQVNIAMTFYAGDGGDWLPFALATDYNGAPWNGSGRWYDSWASRLIGDKYVPAGGGVGGAPASDVARDNQLKSPLLQCPAGLVPFDYAANTHHHVGNYAANVFILGASADRDVRELYGRTGVAAGRGGSGFLRMTRLGEFKRPSAAMAIGEKMKISAVQGGLAFRGAAGTSNTSFNNHIRNGVYPMHRGRAFTNLLMLDGHVADARLAGPMTTIAAGDWLFYTDPEHWQPSFKGLSATNPNGVFITARQDIGMTSVW